MAEYIYASKRCDRQEAAAPTLTQIANVLGRVHASYLAERWSAIHGGPATTADDWGGWAAPRARITRLTGYNPATCNNVTTVASVWSLPDTSSLSVDQRARFINSILASSLAADSSAWEAPTMAVFNPAVSGPLSGWTSGAMANTRTGNSFPDYGGQLDAVESPVGPCVVDGRQSLAQYLQGRGCVAPAPSVVARAGTVVGVVALGLLAVGGAWWWINRPPTPVTLASSTKRPRARTNRRSR